MQMHVAVSINSATTALPLTRHLVLFWKSLPNTVILELPSHGATFGMTRSIVGEPHTVNNTRSIVKSCPLSATWVAEYSRYCLIASMAKA